MNILRAGRAWAATGLLVLLLQLRYGWFEDRSAWIADVLEWGGRSMPFVEPLLVTPRLDAGRWAFLTGVTFLVAVGLVWIAAYETVWTMIDRTERQRFRLNEYPRPSAWTVVLILLLVAVPCVMVVLLFAAEDVRFPTWGVDWVAAAAGVVAMASILAVGVAVWPSSDKTRRHFADQVASRTEMNAVRIVRGLQHLDAMDADRRAEILHEAAADRLWRPKASDVLSYETLAETPGVTSR